MSHCVYTRVLFRELFRHKILQPLWLCVGAVRPIMAVNECLNIAGRNYSSHAAAMADFNVWKKIDMERAISIGWEGSPEPKSAVRLSKSG